jgi:hypothetical protein
MLPANATTIAPTSEVQDEAPGAMQVEQSVAIRDGPAPGLFRRVVTKMRGRP